MLFIDEMHTVVGAGRSRRRHRREQHDEAGPRSGELQCIGGDYGSRVPQLHRKRFGPGTPLPAYPRRGAQTSRRQSRCFTRCAHATRPTIRSMSPTPDWEAAARLSKRYITERLLPDKAVDLIDEAASKIRMDVQSLPERAQRDGEAASTAGKRGGSRVAAR